MVKINFNTPLQHCQRDDLIRGMHSLGFEFERIYQNGVYQLFKFSGKLPCDGKKENIDISISDDIEIKDFKSMLVSNVEIYIMVERS